MDELSRIAPVGYAGPLYRATLFRYLRAVPGGAPIDVLDCSYSTRNGQRYTPQGGPPSLYLSFTPGTPFIEVNRLSLPSARPTVTFACSARLDAVLDLTLPGNTARLHLSPDELACEWDLLQFQGQSVPTHQLAVAVAGQKRFHAIKFASVRDTAHQGVNLAVFCDLVRAPNYVEVQDLDGNLIGRVG